MTITLNCSDRKALARKLAEHLGVNAEYLGPPTFAYRIGALTVERDGSLTSEPDDIAAVQPFLIENGYIEAPAAEAEQAVPEVEEADFEAPADLETSDTPLPDRVSVSIPLESYSAEALHNLLRVLYARQDLIAAMTRCEYIEVSCELLDRMTDEQANTVEHILDILADDVALGLVKGIRAEDGKLTIETTYNPDDPAGWNYFAELILRIAAYAAKAKRVNCKRIQPAPGEMKYFCHSWLMQLGMGGADFKAARAALLGHLEGYTAFRTEEKMTAHKEKYSWLRKSLREDRENEEDAHEADR